MTPNSTLNRPSHRRSRRGAGARVRLAVLAALAIGSVGLVQAQSPSGLGGLAPTGSKGYIGGSFGNTSFDPPCRTGFGCDDSDRGLKLTAGAITNEIWGAEFGLVDFGKATASGGSQKARALSLSGTANFEFAPGFIGFAKLGLTYGRTKTSAAPFTVSTGSKNSIGPNWGLGLAYQLHPQWSIVGEFEQYRIRFAPGRQTLDLLTIGVRYHF